LSFHGDAEVAIYRFLFSWLVKYLVIVAHVIQVYSAGALTGHS